MKPRHASIARATLPLAVALCCAQAWTQTVQAIPLNSPKPKAAEKARTVTLEPPKALPAAKPKTIDAEGPAEAKPGTAPKPKDISDTAPPPATEAPVKSFAPQPVLDAPLAQQIKALTHNTVAIYAWQLNTKKALDLNADRPLQTASVVQLALFWETLRQIALGNAHWDDPIAATPLREATSRMVLMGDTTVPPTLVNQFTLNRVDQDLTNFGYTAAWQKPITAATTPRQMVRLLQHIGMCDLDLPTQLHVNTARADAACRMATTMMRDHLYLDTIPQTTAGSPLHTYILAARTGPIVVAIDTGTAPETPLPNILQTIVNAWSPQGLDPALWDKPHLGVSWE